MNSPLVSLSGLPDEGAHCLPEYWRAIMARDQCKHCGVCTLHSRKVDGPIPMFEGTRALIAPIWYLRSELVHHALYNIIAQDLPPHWVWKIIPDARGLGQDQVAVLVRRKYRPVAHASGYAPELCKKCGEIKYPKGRLTYVVRNTLPAHPITQTDGGWFIAEKTYAAKLAKKFPRKIRLTPFEVRESAPEPTVSK